MTVGGFAAVVRNPRPERPFASCVPGRSYRPISECIITYNRRNRWPYRDDWLVPLPTPLVPSRRNRTSATESGESFAWLIGDAHTAHPVELVSLGLVGRQQGIRHESAIIEDGVVEPRHSSRIRRRSTEQPEDVTP